MELVESIVATRFKQAFPSALQPDVEVVLAALQPSANLPSGDDLGPMVVQGEIVLIPARVYIPAPEPATLGGLTANQQLVMHCFFSRHHDGYVRERMLRAALPACTDWAMPFIVQLLGEYVIEIVNVLEEEIRQENEPMFAEFLIQNPVFWARTRQRIFSYWDCYYRRQFPELMDYPASRVATRFEQWRATSLSRAAQQAVSTSRRASS